MQRSDLVKKAISRKLSKRLLYNLGAGTLAGLPVGAVVGAVSASEGDRLKGAAKGALAGSLAGTAMSSAHDLYTILGKQHMRPLTKKLDMAMTDLVISQSKKEKKKILDSLSSLRKEIKLRRAKVDAGSRGLLYAGMLAIPTSAALAGKSSKKDK